MDSKRAPSEVSKGERTDPIRLGSDGVDVESPVEFFSSPPRPGTWPSQLSEDLTLEGVVGAYWFPLSGDCQDVALLDVE